jgi:ElaB/YqjD/DUF883 family membrane-anchored ribosome-binding protein
MALFSYSLAGFLFFNSLASAGRLAEEKKVLRQNLFAVQVELERILKQLEDEESFYEDVVNELKYSNKRPADKVREMMEERVTSPVKVLIERAEKVLVSTDRNPEDKKVREKKKAEYFEKRARGLLQGSEGNEGVESVESAPIDGFASDSFPSDNQNSNDMSGSDGSKDKW